MTNDESWQSFLNEYWFQVTIFQLEKMFGKGSEAKAFIAELTKGFLTVSIHFTGLHPSIALTKDKAVWHIHRCGLSGYSLNWFTWDARRRTAKRLRCTRFWRRWSRKTLRDQRPKAQLLDSFLFIFLTPFSFCIWGSPFWQSEGCSCQRTAEQTTWRVGWRPGSHELEHRGHQIKKTQKRKVSWRRMSRWSQKASKNVTCRSNLLSCFSPWIFVYVYITLFALRKALDSQVAGYVEWQCQLRQSSRRLFCQKFTGTGH